MNIKFDYCKCIRIYEKAHLRSDIRKKNISLAGARTHKSITLVEGKNSKCTSLIMNAFQMKNDFLCSIEIHQYSMHTGSLKQKKPTYHHVYMRTVSQKSDLCLILVFLTAIIRRGLVFVKAKFPLETNWHRAQMQNCFGYI